MSVVGLCVLWALSLDRLGASKIYLLLDLLDVMEYESGDGESVETENIEETVLALGYKAFIAFLGVGTAIIVSKRRHEEQAHEHAPKIEFNEDAE